MWSRGPVCGDATREERRAADMAAWILRSRNRGGGGRNNMHVGMNSNAKTALVLATIALFALLLVPHLLDSIHETGSPLGVLRSSASTPRKQHYLGEGLVTRNDQRGRYGHAAT